MVAVGRYSVFAPFSAARIAVGSRGEFDKGIVTIRVIHGLYNLYTLRLR